MPLTLRDHLKRDGWLPLTSFHAHQAIAERLKVIHEPKQPITLEPSVEALKNLIEKDTDLYMGFTQMFKEAGRASLVPDYVQMIDLINDIILHPPIFRDPRGGAPGLSFNNILSAVIVTPSGFTTFINDALNKALQAILADWYKYLSSPDSATESLTVQKWLGNESIFVLSQYLKDFNPAKPTTDAFKRAFVPKGDELKDHWGFQSWNAFFARSFIDINYDRPLPPPDVNDILSPVDSRVYGIATNVSATDTFWLKGHRYSLKYLLNGDEGGTRHEAYIGGTVYQAYLLPSDFHRWAMPFAGSIKEIVSIPGTYFALSNALVDPTQPDEFTSLVEGLPYLSTVSARKIAIIKADNDKIGEVCFIPVGLQEISSVEFTAQVKQPLKTGDELGMFKYGGSTVCMVFGPNANIKWAVSQMEHVLTRTTKIATVY